MRAELPRRLGLLNAVTIVAGTIIGSGIFLVPNLVARQLPSPAAILGVWIFSGLLSLAGALAFAELGAMSPASGGLYAYLREAFGPLAAFLCGWSFFVVVLTAAIAWLSVTFSIYLSAFLPLSPIEQKVASVTIIAVLSFINFRGVMLGARVQNMFAFLKIGGILLLIGAALLSPVNHWSEPQSGSWTISQFGAAMIACLLTYDGWIALSLVAGEVKNPQRNLPLGLIAGIGVCIVLYVAVNFAYLKILPVAETAQTQRVAARVAEIAIGPAGSLLVSGIILLSIAGAINGWMMSAPRIYFEQARDGLFFRQFAEVHPRFLTPGFSILLQAVWAIVLCLTGTYETLGAYAMFAAWLFYGITVLGAIVLRIKRPDAPRPYRMWGYPVLPVLFAIVAFGFVLNTAITDPKPALSGSALILAGVPAYWLWQRRDAR
jgi:APA family basic amino acid/polyamine antiporter